MTRSMAEATGVSGATVTFGPPTATDGTSGTWRAWPGRRGDRFHSAAAAIVEHVSREVRRAIEQYRVAYLGCKADALGAMLTPEFDAAVAPGTVMEREVMLKDVAGCLVDKLTFETMSQRHREPRSRCRMW